MEIWERATWWGKNRREHNIDDPNYAAISPRRLVFRAHDYCECGQAFEEHDLTQPNRGFALCFPDEPQVFVLCGATQTWN